MRVTSSATSFAVQPGVGVDLGAARGRFALRLGLDLRPAHESERFDTTAPAFETTFGAEAQKAFALSKGERVAFRFTSGLVWRVGR
jgi:hypothetical protein